MHIAAGAEIATVRQDHNDIYILGIDKRPESIAKLRIALEGQRILALRPGKAKMSDAVLDLPEEVLRLQIGELRVDGSTLPIAAERGKDR